MGARRGVESAAAGGPLRDCRHDTTGPCVRPRSAGPETNPPLRFSGRRSRMQGRVSSRPWGEGAHASTLRSGDEAPVGIHVSRLATQAAARFLPGGRPTRSPSWRRAAGTAPPSSPFTTPRPVLAARFRRRARPPGNPRGASRRVAPRSSRYGASGDSVLPQPRVVPLQLLRIGTDVPNPQRRGLLSGGEPESEYRRDSRPHDVQYATRYGLEVFRCCIASSGRARQV